MKLTKILPIALLFSGAFVSVTGSIAGGKSYLNEDRLHDGKYNQSYRASYTNNSDRGRNSRLIQQKHRLIRNAENLRRNAWRLTRDLRLIHGHRYVTQRAKSLAREAGYFKRSLRNGQSAAQLRRNFWRLKNNFRRLNRVIYRNYYRYDYNKVSFSLQKVRRTFFRLQRKVNRIYDYGNRPYYSNRAYSW